jgi:adenylate cyclase
VPGETMPEPERNTSTPAVESSDSHDPVNPSVENREAPVSGPLKLPSGPSIAVLPFENMSADPEQEYCADRITEDLITGLSKIPGLLVISRNSTFTYKGKAAIAQDVCRDLGVRYMMEGSVRKAGQQVRITAQLIDGSSGGHVWAERYDRGLADIFAVQDDVTEKIVRALEANLVANSRDRVARVETGIPEAYDCVLRGREQYRLFTKQGNLDAARLYEKAIELDPGYAGAYASLAMTRLHDWFLGSPEALEQGYELALKANALDPSLPLVYEALGNIQLFRKHYEESVAAASRWIEIEPGNADAYANLAAANIFCGEHERVVQLIERAMRLNPYYPFYYVLYQGKAYMLMERYEDALEAFKRSIALNPEALYAQIYLAACYGLLGNEAEGREAMAQVRQNFPDISTAWVYKFLPYRRDTDLNRILEGLRAAGLAD